MISELAEQVIPGTSRFFKLNWATGGGMFDRKQYPYLSFILVRYVILLFAIVPDLPNRSSHDTILSFLSLLATLTPMSLTTI